MKSDQFVIVGNPTAFFTRHKLQAHTYDYHQKAHIDFERQLEDLGSNIPLSGPLHIDIEFYLPMPKVNAVKRKELEGTYDYNCVNIHQLLEFLKTLKSSGVYSKECMIASICAKKVYSATPKVVFTLSEI